MATPARNISFLVVLLALIQALRDGRITLEELQQIITLILVAIVLPQFALN